MDTLVALGSTTAFGYSTWALLSGAGGHLYFMEAAAIISLISVGHWIEARVSERASGALKSLLNLAPQTARRLSSPHPDPLPRGEGTATTAARKFMVSGSNPALDQLLPLPTGEGRGEGNLNLKTFSFSKSAIGNRQSAIEGGSRCRIKIRRPHGAAPRRPRAGGRRSRGRRIRRGRSHAHRRIRSRRQKIRQRTVRRHGEPERPPRHARHRHGRKHRAAHIIAAVQRAQTSRADIQRLGDRISNVFVPIIVTIALAAGLWWGLAPESAEQVHEFLARFLWNTHAPMGVAAGSSSPRRF